MREQRLKEYAEKKSKKPGPIAKSSVLLDCKPWDDETDMGVMEKEIRKIQMDGLTWGAGKCPKLFISDIQNQNWGGNYWHVLVRLQLQTRLKSIVHYIVIH